jgi:hypothetical protein
MIPRIYQRQRTEQGYRVAGATATSPVHPLLALQATSGNRAVAAALNVQRCGGDTLCGCEEEAAELAKISVQRDRRATQDEESAPSEGGAEESGLSDLTCELLPDAAVVALVRAYFALRYPLASRHLVHYLEGSGTPFIEDIPGLLAANPRGAERIAEQIRARGGSGSGQLIGRTTDTAIIRQRDYDSEDWRLSLGGIDQFDYEVGERNDDGTTTVTLSLHDPYQWHPAEDRGSQCLHEVMERQKQKGAQEFNSEGTGTVRLRL